MSKKPRTRVIRRRNAGRRHAVVSVLTTGRDKHAFRKEPCEECPWRVDQVGAFPAQAFRHSAATAYDAAMSCFGCHMSKHTAPATCAGFLLSEGAIHNLLVRIGMAAGRLDLDAVHSDVPLFPSYRLMAIANGVAPDDPVLEPCRDLTSEGEKWSRVRTSRTKLPTSSG
jgi:hypothetical protein